MSSLLAVEKLDFHELAIAELDNQLELKHDLNAEITLVLDEPWGRL